MCREISFTEEKLKEGRKGHGEGDKEGGRKRQQGREGRRCVFMRMDSVVTGVCIQVEKKGLLLSVYQLPQLVGHSRIKIFSFALYISVLFSCCKTNALLLEFLKHSPTHWDKRVL